MDDEIIKQRLQIEPKQLKKLVKKYSAKDDSQLALEAYEIELGLFNANISKFNKIREINDRELQNHETNLLQVERLINETILDINELKVKVEHIKKIKQNRLEYDAIWSEINKFPSQQDSIKKIEIINLEIAKLYDEKRLQDQSIELRASLFKKLSDDISCVSSILKIDADEMEIRQARFFNESIDVVDDTENLYAPDIVNGDDQMDLS